MLQLRQSIQFVFYISHVAPGYALCSRFLMALGSLCPKHLRLGPSLSLKALIALAPLSVVMQTSFFSKLVGFGSTIGQSWWNNKLCLDM